MVIAAHSLSQFVLGSVVGLGFLGLLHAALSGCNYSIFLRHITGGEGVVGSNPAASIIFLSKNQNHFFLEDN